MTKKWYAVFLVAVLLVAFVVSPVSAACSKCAKSSTCASCASGATVATPTKYKVVSSCVNRVCITYVKCNGNEYIKICNGRNASVNLNRYKVVYKCKNCNTKTFTFPNVTLKAGQCVYVYTGKGTNHGNAVFNGFTGDIIKCKGMNIELHASCGKLLSSVRY